MSKEKLIKVEDNAACFVCGQENPIGLKAEFSVDETAHTSFASVHLAAEFQGWQNVVHGGILATLLDESCIYACRTKADQCVTAEIKVRYRKPVPIGATVELFGKLTDNSRKIWSAEAQLKIAGTLYAEAHAKVFILDKH